MPRNRLQKPGRFALAHKASHEGRDIRGKSPHVGENNNGDSGINGAYFLREIGRRFCRVEPVIEKYQPEILAEGNFGAGESYEDRLCLVPCLLHQESIDLQMHRVIVHNEDLWMTGLQFFSLHAAVSVQDNHKRVSGQSGCLCIEARRARWKDPFV